VLITMLADTAATTSGFDWTKIIGIPGGIAAVITVITTFNGIRHPIAVKKPAYWHDHNNTRMKFTVRNRRFLFDTTVDSVIIARAPGLFKRLFTKNWQTGSVPVSFVPFGDAVPRANAPIKLTKRQEQQVQIELRTNLAEPAPELTIEDGVRIWVGSGSHFSRTKKITFEG
jgi:hypothetical protein